MPVPCPPDQLQTNPRQRTTEQQSSGSIRWTRKPRSLTEPISLPKLWDEGAVRIQPGRPAEVSKAVIYANDKRWEASGPAKTLCYDLEIQDLQIAGDWAFEWSYFSYRDTAEPKPVHGKVMRVMKRQSDGSWKFARVMGFPEKDPAAAPVSHPCE